MKYMEIKEISDKNAWEEFLKKCKEKTFLCSWNWGEFLKKEGNKVWRFGAYENNNLSTIFPLAFIKARRGSFLFAPHSPFISKEFLKKAKEIAGQEHAKFIRISPVMENTEENNRIFKDLGFIPAPTHMHP